jgi:hypothetical protein
MLALKDPLVNSTIPIVELSLSEPQRNLGLGTLRAVRAMAHVSTKVNAEVTADRSNRGSKGVGGSEHNTALESTKQEK